MATELDIPYAIHEATDFHERRLVKPDGRAMKLYSRRRIADGIKATNPVHDPITGAAHMRWHPLRGEWVAYASHRQNRTFLPPKAFNPLQPTTSEEFPTELPAGDYDVAVFENLFPSLSMSSTGAPTLHVPTMPAQGVCEVVVFTQDAEAKLGGLELDHIELLLRVWADRTRELGQRPGIDYVLPFENRGVEVGVTLHHPHGQIYAYPFIPPIISKMCDSQRAYLEEHGRGMLEDLLKAELRDGSRLVTVEGGGTSGGAGTSAGGAVHVDVDGDLASGLSGGSPVMAFVPAFARYPYEVWIAPLRKAASLAELTRSEISALARVLKTVLLKYDALWGRPFPYLMAIYQAPTDQHPHPEFHFHIEFYPPYRSRDRLKFLAGTELAAGLFVNDSLPEEKADELRKVEVTLT